MMVFCWIILAFLALMWLVASWVVYDRLPRGRRWLTPLLGLAITVAFVVYGLSLAFEHIGMALSWLFEVIGDWLVERAEACEVPSRPRTKDLFGDDL